MRPAARLAALAAALLLGCKPAPAPAPEDGARAALAALHRAAAAGDREGVLRLYAEDFASIYPGASRKSEVAAFLARDPGGWRAFYAEEPLAWVRAEEGRVWAATAAALPAGEQLSEPLPPATRTTLYQLRREGPAWRIESFRTAVLRESRGWIDAALGAPPSGEERTAAVSVAAPGVVEIPLPETGEAAPIGWEIANDGAPVRGFRLTPEEGGVWDLGAWIEGARASAKDEEALARALWRFATRHRMSTALDPPEALRSPALFLAASGEGQCGWAARTLASLWKAAGLEGRVYLLGGHAVAEARIGERRRLYDADQGAYYESGGEVLSAALLARRPDVVAATADALGRGPGGLPAREMAALYADWKRHGTEEAEAAALPSLGVDLAPGDRLTLRMRAEGAPPDLREARPLLRAEGTLEGPIAAATGVASLGSAEKADAGRRFRFPISPWLLPSPAADAPRVRVAFEAAPGAAVFLRITFRYRAR